MSEEQKPAYIITIIGQGYPQQQVQISFNADKTEPLEEIFTKIDKIQKHLDLARTEGGKVLLPKEISIPPKAK